MNDPARRERAPFDAWVEITTARGRCRARAFDLSVEGIGVEFDGPHPEEASDVVSEFALPGIGLPLELKGAIAWSRPDKGRLGVRFHDVDPGLAELLCNFVAGRF